MSERQESIMRSQAILMFARNHNKPHIIRRITKRFLKCLNR